MEVTTKMLQLILLRNIEYTLAIKLLEKNQLLLNNIIHEAKNE